jgi:hypothetical protein
VEENFRETKRNSAKLLEVFTNLENKQTEHLMRAEDFPQLPVSTTVELTGLNAIIKDDAITFGKMVSINSIMHIIA